MKKTVVIYKTKYNSTKKYAGWLCIKLAADLYELSDIRGYDLKKYDNIIFGGPLENGYIKGIDFIKENYQLIKNKNVVVFYVGLGVLKKETVVAKNFYPRNLYENIKIFELRGDFDYKKLNLIDKFKIIYGNIEKKSKIFYDKKNISCTQKSNLKEILDYLDTL